MRIQKYQRGFAPILILIAILVIGGLVGGAYFLGKQSNQSSQIQNTTPTSKSIALPTSIESSRPSVTQYMDNGIPVSEQTVSFTRNNGEVYLRYKGKIYQEDDTQQLTPKEISLSQPNNYTWYGLVEAPSYRFTKYPGLTPFDEIFSFKVLPNKDNFLFVMRWPQGDDEPNQQFKVYYYDKSSQSQKVSMVFSSTPTDFKGYAFPKIDQISDDGVFVSFYMFGCWNCGGHKPETLLLNLSTKATKRIGKTSYFKWRQKGIYEYKEYKVKECAEPQSGGCFEDPTALSLLTGNFYE